MPAGASAGHIAFRPRHRLSDQIAGAAELDQFPSVLLDSIARNFGHANFPFTSLFGQAVNLDLDTQLHDQSGPLRFRVHSPNTRAALKGNINKGVLTLSEPVHAQILMSKELSQWLVQDVNPLSISAIYANNPLTLEIAPDGFSSRSSPLKWAGSNSPRAGSSSAKSPATTTAT